MLSASLNKTFPFLSLLDVSDREEMLVSFKNPTVLEGKKEVIYLTTYSTHFIYGIMASDICQTTIQIAREETRCLLVDDLATEG